MKNKKRKLEVGFMSAPGVYDVARKLIQTESDFEDLIDEKILFLFTRKPITDRGEKVPFQVTKLSGRNAFLANSSLTEDEWVTPSPQFLVIVYRDAWLLMTSAMQEACVDSILCRCNVERLETGKRLKIVKPDIEEFTAVVARRGQNWMPSNLMSQAVSGQPQLDIIETENHFPEPERAGRKPKGRIHDSDYQEARL